jgi:hypothetical protein
MMANGKPLRACTFSECAQFSGWLGRLAARGAPDDLVGTLSEADVRRVYDEGA